MPGNSDARQRGWFWAIVLFALCVRLGAAWYWNDQVQRSGAAFRFGDSHSYWVMASRIARGGPYQYGSENSKIFRAPLYPILLAPWTTIGPGNPSPNGVWLARCMGCCLGAGAVACVMIMTRMVWGPNVAIVAGFLASVYPGAVAMSIFVLSEAIATPMFILSCTCLLWALRHPQRAQVAYLAAGAALGLACLARPSWSVWPIVALPFAFAVVKPTTFRDGRRFLVGWAVFATAVVAIMAPWWIRNYAITGKWVPTTLQVGASLYDGWHPGASGSSDENMDFVLPFIADQEAEDEMLAKQGMPLESTLEWRVDRRLRQAALAWAWENPSDVIRLSLVKCRKMWSPLPVAREVQPLVRWSEGIGYVALMGGALVGAWRGRRERGAWLAWMPCLYLAILHAVFIGSVRYRQPGVMLLSPLAAAGWMLVVPWMVRRGVKATERQNEVG